MSIISISVTGMIAICWSCRCVALVECLYGRKVDNGIEEDKMVKLISYTPCKKHKGHKINSIYVTREIDKALSIYKVSLLELLCNYYTIELPYEISITTLPKAS